MNPASVNHKRILLSALNWGLGHVMRSVPLLAQLQKQNNQIFIACDEYQEAVFRKEISGVEFIRIQGYPFVFSGKGNFTRDLLKSIVSLDRMVKYERKWVTEKVLQLGIQLVISDQRMGFRSRKCTSVLLTHQVHLPLKWWEMPAQWIYGYWLSRFDFIWIPDKKGEESLAGRLSKTKRKNALYIGWLSRFSYYHVGEKKYEYAAIISGPEPYNFHFFEEVKEQFKREGKRTFILFHRAKEEKIGEVEIYKEIPTEKLTKMLLSSKAVVSRSGYSTLMDLERLNMRGILTPTPGQSEQEYLAAYYKKRKVNDVVQ